MDNESVGRTLYDLIGGFFRRDLSYIVGGGLLVLVLNLSGPYAWIAAVNASLPFSLGSEHGWVAILAWVLMFYMLGFVSSECADLAGVINKRKTLPATYSSQGGEHIQFYTQNQGKREALKIHERTIGFMHMSSSMGVGLLTALVISAYLSEGYGFNFWMGAVLLGLGFVTRWYVRAVLHFTYRTLGSKVISGVGDAWLMLGVYLLVQGGVEKNPVFVPVFVSGWICLYLSRHFSREIIREREWIEALGTVPPVEAAVSPRKRKS